MYLIIAVLYGYSFDNEKYVHIVLTLPGRRENYFIQ